MEQKRSMDTNNNKRTVLFIVTESESANGICSLAVMQEMIKQEYKVYCITNQESGRVGKYTKDGISYYTVKPRLSYRIESFLKHNKILSLTKWVIKKINWFLNKAKLLLCVFTWPLISILYSYRIYSVALQIFKVEHIDCIIAVYTQIDTIIAAHKIKKNNDVNYIAYFLDSLSGGYGPKYFTKKQIIRRGLYWERRLLNNADKIIVMESSRKHHEIYSINETYYNRLSILDLPLLIKHNNIIAGCNVLDHSKINIVFIGSLNINMRDPQVFINVFHKTKSVDFRLYFIGTNTCSDILSKAVKTDPRINLISSVTHEIALTIMNQANILVNIGNKIENMTPSKIFEYMAAGKPIISTYPMQNEPSMRYLTKYPLLFAIDENNVNENLIANDMEGFIIKHKNATVNFDQLISTFQNNTPQKFVDEMDRLYQ